MSKKVVITGIGIISPLANNVKDYWAGLEAGKSGVTNITKFNPDEREIPVKIAGEVKNFDPKNYNIDRKLLRGMDTFSMFGMAAAKEAIEMAKLKESDIDKERVGVVVGSGIGGMEAYQKNVMDFNTKNKLSPFFIPMIITDMCSGLIAIEYGYMGPNFSISTACATANHSILDSYHIIKRGDADIMITGGTEGSVNDLTVGAFAIAQAISRRNDAPEKASRPWDKDRDGFVVGEGAGVLVLESEESAKRRGATILAEVVGAGMSADAYHMTAPHPEGKGAALCMKRAIESAGIKLEDVQSVNAHGTSTELGDIAETEAIKLVFGAHAKKLKVNSTKSMIGHLLGAAGGAEAVAVILEIMNGKIHPTINLDNPGEGLDLDYTANKAVACDLKYALSNSFGFGGHNCSVIFGRYQK